MRIIPWIPFFLILAGAPATAWAMNGMQGVAPEQKFKALDTNGDNQVSREEFNAFYPQMHDAAFTTIDTSGDGVISLEEWLAFCKGHSRDMKASGMDSMPLRNAEKAPEGDQPRLLMPGEFGGGKAKPGNGEAPASH